jgi:hypothetical protein
MHSEMSPCRVFSIYEFVPKYEVTSLKGYSHETTPIKKVS